MEFVIYSPGFNDRIGGVYAMHLLCHLINQTGGRASMYPWFYHDEISAIHIKAPLEKALRSRELLNNYPGYLTNPRWSTPLYTSLVEEIEGRDDVVVVYPEVTFGNPLRAKHIARWLLNTPGVHNKKIFFTHGEVQFLYREFFTPLKQYGVEVAPFLLHVLEIPWDIFDISRYPSDEHIVRKGTAYALRKGKGKEIQHDLTDSILIDNLPLVEIASVFRRIKTFISYDTASLYSQLAVLSGCDSVVIPEEGVPKASWRVKEEDSYGVAYGFGEIESSRLSQHKVTNMLHAWEKASINSIQSFIDFWCSRTQGKGT